MYRGKVIRWDRFYYLVWLAIVSVLLPACNSHRSLIKGPIKEEGSDYLFQNLKEKEFKFRSFSAKFNVEYRNDRKLFEFKGQVKIIKDSIIWVSFNQDLGVEIARLLITQDSVMFLDRFNKKYFIGDYDFVNQFLKTNIDFGVLESIILGNDFEYYENARFKASIDGGAYKLTTTGRSKLKKYVRNHADNERILLQSIWLNPETFKITQIKMKELTGDSKKLTAQYSDFENIQNQLFPFRINYSIEAENPIDVKIKFTKITLNEDLSYPFKISSKYEPIN
nr:DUF4292 domain-containing protein [Bacteroidota bacterium]